MSVREIPRGAPHWPVETPSHAALDLLGSEGTARIVLPMEGGADQVYTLRLTRARKLILTK